MIKDIIIFENEKFTNITNIRWTNRKSTRKFYEIRLKK